MKRTIAMIVTGAALASCADLHQQPLTFWGKKDDVIIVHHVDKTGKDHEEKLTDKPNKELDGRYFKVSEVDSTFEVAKKKAKQAKDEMVTAKLEAKIADLKREVDDLKDDRHHEDKPTAKRDLDQDNAIATADPSPTPLAPMIQEGQ
jgi:hypothetical protein